MRSAMASRKSINISGPEHYIVSINDVYFYI